MRFSTIVISLLLFGALVTGMYSFVNDLSSPDAFNIEIDDSYSAQFDKTDNISKEVSGSYEKMQNFTTNKGIAIQIITLVPDGLSLMKNVVKIPLTLIGGMITAIVTEMGLPFWAQAFLATIIVVLILFAFVALVFRYRYT